MIESARELPYVPENNLNRERIIKVGVGIFIIDLNNSKIWIVKEKHSKNGINGKGRKIGDLTIPLETRKSGEKILDNVMGGLAEFRQLTSTEELIWLDGVSYVGRYVSAEGVLADLVLLGLKNKSSVELPIIDNQEVEAAGWMALDELRKQTQLRLSVIKFLDIAHHQNWIENFVIAASNSHHQRKLNSSTVIADLFRKRELQPDLG